MMAPQRKRQKEHTKMVQSLNTGDKVLIAGGIYASISAVKDDRFVVAISNDTKIEILKSAVQSKVEADAEAKKLVASK